MKTYINKLKLRKQIVTIHPGDIITSKKHSIISTLLGSCVAVCLRDQKTGISGMNHFLLPGNNKDVDFASGAVGRYGISSMENLINKMLHCGAIKSRLVAKIFGGGSVIPNFKVNIGQKNIDFVRWFMNNEKIPIVGEDVGGKIARKIYFFTKDGTVLVENITSKVESNELVKEEKSYFQRAKDHLRDSDITIF